MTELEIQNITDYNSRYTILSVKAQAIIFSLCENMVIHFDQNLTKIENI